MARLTIRLHDGAIGCLQEYGTKDLISKLADYEDAEDNGVLYRFPCVVGDTVYKVYFPNRLVEPYTYKSVKIESLSQLAGFFEDGLFGKTIFVDEKQAKARVSELFGKIPDLTEE